MAQKNQIVSLEVCSTVECRGDLDHLGNVLGELGKQLLFVHDDRVECSFLDQGTSRGKDVAPGAGHETDQPSAQTQARPNTGPRLQVLQKGNKTTRTCGAGHRAESRPADKRAVEQTSFRLVLRQKRGT